MFHNMHVSNLHVSTMRVLCNSFKGNKQYNKLTIICESLITRLVSFVFISFPDPFALGCLPVFSLAYPGLLLLALPLFPFYRQRIRPSGYFGLDPNSKLRRQFLHFSLLLNSLLFLLVLLYLQYFWSLGQKLLVGLLLHVFQGCFVNIFHGYSLVGSKIDNRYLLKFPQSSPQGQILRAYKIFPLIGVAKLLKNAMINRSLKRVLAINNFMFLGLFQHQAELLAQKFEFPEDARSDPQGDSSVDGIFEFAVEVQLLFDNESDEVAVEDELVGVVELVVDAEEVDDFVYLLIVHCDYKPIAKTKLWVQDQL